MTVCIDIYIYIQCVCIQCVIICIYIMCIYIYMYRPTYVWICIYVCMYLYIYIYNLSSLYTYVYIHIMWITAKYSYNMFICNHPESLMQFQKTPSRSIPKILGSLSKCHLSAGPHRNGLMLWIWGSQVLLALWCTYLYNSVYIYIYIHIYTYIYIYIHIYIYNVVKTIINHPPVITRNSWYKHV